MNLFLLGATAAVLVAHGVQLAADLLNLRALSGDLPSSFAGVYDEPRYRRSQEYARARIRLAILASSVQLLVLLVFWYAGGFAWLDGLVRELAGGAVARGLLFLAALALASALVGLPFRIYGTFVVEERFGFNRTTPRTFLADLAKGLLLAVVLGGPLAAAILWLFDAAGAWAWILCWALTAGWVLAVQLVAPRWILPLFLKFRPLEDAQLREALLAYAERVDFPVEGIFVVDGSRRSTKANAFFTGVGRRKRIALFDTLVEKHERDEVLAVLAHEVGHHRLGHVPKSLAVGILQSGLVFLLLGLLLPWEPLYRAFLVQEPSVYAGLVFFGILYAPIDLVLSSLVQALSRRHEYEADEFARRTTGSGERLAAALRRLAADSLENLSPHPFYVKLNYSHPPVTRRVERLETETRGLGHPPPAAVGS